jgi:hypothetical protein
MATRGVKGDGDCGLHRNIRSVGLRKQRLSVETVEYERLAELKKFGVRTLLIRCGTCDMLPCTAQVRSGPPTVGSEATKAAPLP